MNRNEVYKKYNGHCAYCGDKLKFKDMQIDHIIPKSNFNHSVKTQIMHPNIDLKQIPNFLKHLTIDDLNHIDNLNLSCRVCNKAKDSFHLELFRTELEVQHHRARLYSRNYRFALKYKQVKETPKPIVFYFENKLLKK